MNLTGTSSTLSGVSQHSARGFDVANYWIRAYYRMQKRQPPKFSAAQKKAMTMQFSVLRQAFSRSLTERDEIKAVIDFIFLHNPLNYSQVSEYNLTTPVFSQVLSRYCTWKRECADLIRDYGLRVAVALTAETKTEDQIEYARALQQNGDWEELFEDFSL